MATKEEKRLLQQLAQSIIVIEQEIKFSREHQNTLFSSFDQKISDLSKDFNSKFSTVHGVLDTHAKNIKTNNEFRIITITEKRQAKWIVGILIALLSSSWGVLIWLGNLVIKLRKILP